MTRYLATAARTYGLDEYEQLPSDELYTIELAAGWLVHEPAPGPEHGRIQTRMARLLDEHVERHALGVVLSNTGFVLFHDPPTVRVPDLAFIASANLQGQSFDDGLWRAAPDVAVEINSPSNSASDNQRKVREYLDAGVRLVWIVDPPTRTVTIYESRSAIRLLTADDELDGGEILTGLRIRISELLGTPPA